MNVFQNNMNKTYIRLKKRFYKYYTKKDLDDSNDIIRAINNVEFSQTKINEEFKFLNDDKIFNDIIITFTNNMNDLYLIIENINIDFIEKLKPYKERFNINKKNIENPCFSFNKEDVLKNLKNTKLTYAERILYGIFMMVEPIKYDDLRFVKINQIKDGKIYLNANKILDIPNEIFDIIDKTNEYLLGMEYTQSGISKLFKNTFQKIYGVSYSVNDIRKRLSKIQFFFYTLYKK